MACRISRHLGDKAFPDVLRGFHQRFAALIVVHQPAKRQALVVGQAFQQIRQIRGVQLAHDHYQFSGLIQQMAVIADRLPRGTVEDTVDKWTVCQ